MLLWLLLLLLLVRDFVLVLKCYMRCLQTMLQSIIYREDCTIETSLLWIFWIMSSIHSVNLHTLSILGLWHCDRFSRRLSFRVLVTMSYLNLEYDASRSLVFGLRVRVHASLLSRRLSSFCVASFGSNEG